VSNEVGVNSSVPGTPGVSGAISDAIRAVRKYLAGKANETAIDQQKYENKFVDGEAGKEDTRVSGNDTEP
jgi:hypothetical protein